MLNSISTMPLFLALIASFVSLVGLAASAWRHDWTRQYSGLVALVAGGMLISLVILQIAPEAIQSSARAPAYILGGFVVGMLLHHLLRQTMSEPKHMSVALGALPVAAIGVHSLLDGAVYTVLLRYSHELGLQPTIALIIHEFPEAIIAFTLLVSAGLSKRLSLAIAFFAAGLTTPLGALIALPFADSVSPTTLGEMFALSAGLLLFVATGPLLAHMEDEHPRRSVPALATGIAFAIVMTSAHSHDHGDAVRHASDPHLHHDHAPHHLHIEQHADRF